MIDHTAELESKVRCLEAANEQLANTRNEWMIRSRDDWKRAEELRKKLEKATEELSHAHAVISAREETINELTKAPHINMAIENAALKQSLETVKAQLRKHQNSAPEKRAAKLEEKIAELEQEIEHIRAAKIYQDCNPEATEADLQCQIVQQKENFADQLHQAEGIILEWQEKYRRAEDMINALEAIKAQMHGELSQAHQEEYNAGRKHEQAQKRIADLEKIKEELTFALAQASKHACDWQEKYNQAQAKLDKLDDENNNLSTEANDRQSSGNARSDRETELESQLTQAFTTIDDLMTKIREISAENCNLLSANRELEEYREESSFHHDEISCPECVLKNQRIAQLQELNQFNNGNIDNLKTEMQWQERALASEEIEAATKVVAIAMHKATQGKEGYTPIYTQDIAKATGMKRQAAGRHMNAVVDWGMFSGYRIEEKATVPDVRLGKRDIKKKILHIAPTELLKRPEDWKRGDGKQHGGAGRRCKKCGAENTLRTIPHTVCLHCGAEDIFYPEDAREALEQTRPLQPEDAQAAIQEATAILTKAGPTSEVHDEHHLDIEAAQALLAKMKEHQCDVYIRPEDSQIVISVPKDMSDERFETLRHKVLSLETPLRQILTSKVHHEQQLEEAQETSTGDPRIKRIEAWGAAHGYPKAKMSNGTIIPDGPMGWKGFCKYRTNLHQQAYEDICNGDLKEVKR